MLWGLTDNLTQSWHHKVSVRVFIHLTVWIEWLLFFKPWIRSRVIMVNSTDSHWYLPKLTLLFPSPRLSRFCLSFLHFRVFFFLIYLSVVDLEYIYKFQVNNSYSIFSLSVFHLKLLWNIGYSSCTEQCKLADYLLYTLVVCISYPVPLSCFFLLPHPW